MRPIKQVSARPPGMSALEAASIPVNYFTAWQLIVVMGGLKANETVLIHSAGGGVGIAANPDAPETSAPKSSALRPRPNTPNYARSAPTTSSITERRTSRPARGKSPMATALSSFSTPSAASHGRRLSRPRTDRTARCIRYFRRCERQGTQPARDARLRFDRIPWFQFNPLSLMNANKGVFGVNLGHMWGEIDRQRQWADQLLNLWTQGSQAEGRAHLPFAEAPQAHHFVQDRRNIGKVLLVP